MKKRILVISPHPDDETLGPGGSIAKFAEQGSEVFVLTISGHLPPVYSREDYEITLKEANKAHKVLGIKESQFLEIPATMVKDEPVHELNNKISLVIKNFKPNIVFIPFPDRMVDHRVVFNSSLVATRPVGIGREIELLAAYETISETHWNAPYLEANFSPNLVINIDNQLEKKFKALECYKSQVTQKEGPRSIEAISALARFRGSQSGFEYGEAFYIIRKIL